LNRVKNVSSSHYNPVNSSTINNNNNNNVNITVNDNQRSNGFNSGQRVKSARVNQADINIRDTSNDSMERNNKTNQQQQQQPQSNQTNQRSYYPNNTGKEIKNQQSNVYIEYPLDQIDPNNIMSDPVINEQFHKLYAEDEYFQAVHRKCIEWLTRYVLPEFELLKAEKMQK
jgi:hypothetical protein